MLNPPIFERKMHKNLVLALVAFFCLSLNPTVKAADADKFKLKVALYPYIPEPQKLFDWVKREFEKKNPDIELIVRGADAPILAYDITRAANALTNNKHPEFQHIIEIDTLILSNLVAAEAIQKFSIQRSDFYEFALQSVKIGGEIYGVPHWTCGNFLITTHQSVANAENAIELAKALEQLSTPMPDLGGDLVGDYSAIIIYLDALLDTRSTIDIPAFLDDTAIDPMVEPYLSALSKACHSSGTSMCDKEKGVSSAFAHGALDAVVGYSELLNRILKEPIIIIDKSEIKLTPAPLGGGKGNFLFTDALVLSKTCKTEKCRSAARRFAEFYISDGVFEVAMMSREQKNAIPRYLLPSTKGAFQSKLIMNDIYYRQLQSYMSSAIPNPNAGIPLARSLGIIRKIMQKKINQKQVD